MVAYYSFFWDALNLKSVVALPPPEFLYYQIWQDVYEEYSEDLTIAQIDFYSNCVARKANLDSLEETLSKAIVSCFEKIP